MPLDNNPPDLGQVMSATGQKTFELAFILASGGCSPAWDGTAPVSSDSAVGNVISSIRGAGGDVSVSAGGYGGTKLGQVCSDPQSTAAAYQQVISKYALKAIDFDLEEPEYENSTATPSPTPTGSPTPTPTPTPTSTCTAPAWSSTTSYSGGATVTYNHHGWKAKWWTYNDVPGGPAGVWDDQGSC